MDQIIRGGIYYAQLPKVSKCIQYGTRPILIVSNNLCNKHSPVVTYVPLTSADKKPLPTHVTIPPDTDNGLAYESLALCEQVMTVSKNCLRFIGMCDQKTMREVDEALIIQLGLLV